MKDLTQIQLRVKVQYFVIIIPQYFIVYQGNIQVRKQVLEKTWEKRDVSQN